MKTSNLKKEIITASFCILFVIGLGYLPLNYEATTKSEVTNHTSESRFFQLTENSGTNIELLNENTDFLDNDNATWGYFEWRDYFVLDWYNTTYEDLSEKLKNDPYFQHNLELSIKMFWGLNNGTYTEEDIEEMALDLMHRSVSVSIGEFYETSDETLSLKSEITIKSDAIFNYVVTRSLLGLRSSSEEGKWYNPDGLYYKVFESQVLALMDFCYDDKPTIYTRTINVNTNSLENNVDVLHRVRGFYRLSGYIFLIEDSYFTTIDLYDDDTSPPIIDILYYDGLNENMGTDSQPGYWKINVADAQSGIDLDSLRIRIDDQLVSNKLQHPVPNLLGNHTISVFIRNNDKDRPFDEERSKKFKTVKIIDDDTTGPLISLKYHGEQTDENPGYWSINVTDRESLVSNITLHYDNIIQGPFITKNGYFLYNLSVSNELGKHTIKVEACNRDNDRPSGDMECSIKQAYVSIHDDDLTPPFISVDYTGNGTDGHPGSWLVGISDSRSNISHILIYQNNFLILNETCNIPYYYESFSINRSLGIHTITVIAYNNDKDRGSKDIEGTKLYKEINITDDDVKSPQIKIIPISKQWKNGKISFILNFTAEDDSGISSARMYVQGLTYYGLGIHEIILPPGRYIANLVVTDSDFDRESDDLTNITYYDFFLDLTPPESSLLVIHGYTDINGTIYISRTSKLFLNTNDDISGVSNSYWRLNGATWQNYSGSFHVFGSEGEYLLEYYSVDNEGNIEEIKSEELILDNSVPYTEISFDPSYIDHHGDIVISNLSEFSLSSYDKYSGIYKIYYSFDGINFLEYTASLRVPFDSGIHKIYYYSIDNLGNKEIPKECTIKVDSFPPITKSEIDFYYTDELGNTYITSNTLITLSGTDNLSPLLNIFFRVNHSIWHTYNESFSIEGVDGIYLVEFYGVDLLGNTEKINRVFFILDNKAPKTEIITTPSKIGENNIVYVMEETYFSLYTDDNLSGVSQTFYRLNESDWVLYDEPFNISKKFEILIIEFYSVDNLGNVEDIQSIQIHFAEEIEGFGILRINDEIYAGKAFLYISSESMLMEVENMTVSWDILEYKHLSCLEMYKCEGESGKIIVLEFNLKTKIYIIAIGKGVFFRGS